jgi:hypothetical protein
MMKIPVENTVNVKITQAGILVPCDVKKQQLASVV